MIKSYNKIVLSCVLSGFIFTTANAADLTVKNQTSNDVAVIFEGGGGTIGPNKEAITQSIKSGGALTQKIERTTFGLDTFIVTGKTDSVAGKAKAIISSDNKCGPLSIDKDYTITLIEGKAGMITCQAEETK